MVDLHTEIRQQPHEVLKIIAESMDTRANEPIMQSICARYMSGIPSDNQANILEIGCGNGAATQLIFEHVKFCTLIGVDPASGFIDMARKRFSGSKKVNFEVGDAIDTRQPDESCDLVIAHTVYSHLPDPKAAVQEAFRVLRPGGQLVIFDGDYATITVALFAGDPLQAAVETVIRNMVHGPYVMRGLPAILSRCGFSVESVEPHGYVQTKSPDYLLTLLSRGLNAGEKAGELGNGLVNGFMHEAQARVEAGTFYGAILFISMMATKPA